MAIISHALLYTLLLSKLLFQSLLLTSSVLTLAEHVLCGRFLISFDPSLCAPEMRATRQMCFCRHTVKVMRRHTHTQTHNADCIKWKSSLRGSRFTRCLGGRRAREKSSQEVCARISKQHPEKRVAVYNAIGAGRVKVYTCIVFVDFFLVFLLNGNCYSIGLVYIHTIRVFRSTLIYCGVFLCACVAEELPAGVAFAQIFGMYTHRLYI